MKPSELPIEWRTQVQLTCHATAGDRTGIIILDCTADGLWFGVGLEADVTKGIDGVFNDHAHAVIIEAEPSREKAKAACEAWLRGWLENREQVLACSCGDVQ